MIEIDRLTKRFTRRGTPAVDGLSLHIAAGESVALWGGNGAGKTTIIRCVLGLLRYHGAIRVGGLDAWRDGKRARQLIGYVPQELGFQDELRVDEAVRFFAHLKNQPVRDVDAVLSRVGLCGHGRKRVRELSGGMKQRLALALALLADPPILVLDEVTASLDACGRDEFVTLLSTLAREQHRAMLFASHRAEEIRALATRVVTLDRGRATGDVATGEFLRTRERDTVLHVFLPPAYVPAAIDQLRGGGFDARRNGRGIFVTAQPSARAAAIGRLTEASIPVDDFEIVTADAAREVIS